MTTSFISGLIGKTTKVKTDMANIGISSNDYKYWRYKPTSYTTLSNTSALVKTGDGLLEGVYVASGAFTFKIWDSTSAATTVLVNTTNASTLGLGFHGFPSVKFNTGLYVTMTTTGELTVFYK
jgi:hypothetical protein